mmetsp:Transcript_12830/g.19424  ORF Transcript_12830/g.19424 Transcript_12830/m.19424 type:complete len:239 (-) Transcript_12830:56-772(-)
MSSTQHPSITNENYKIEPVLHSGMLFFVDVMLNGVIGSPRSEALSVLEFVGNKRNMGKVLVKYDQGELPSIDDRRNFARLCSGALKETPEKKYGRCTLKDVKKLSMKQVKDEREKKGYVEFHLQVNGKTPPDVRAQFEQAKKAHLIEKEKEAAKLLPPSADRTDFTNTNQVLELILHTFSSSSNLTAGSSSSHATTSTTSPQISDELRSILTKFKNATYAQGFHAHIDPTTTNKMFQY